MNRNWLRHRTRGKGAVEIYVFYADVFLVNEFLMDAAVLLVAGAFRKCTGAGHILRVLVAAILGSIADTAVLLFAPDPVCYDVSAILVVFPVMIRLVFGWNGLREYVGNLVLCQGISLVMGGILGCADARLGWRRIPLLAILLCTLLGILWIHWLYALFLRQRSLIPVILSRGDVRVRCRGLVDTGNLLRLSPGGEPVHIVSEEVFRKLGLSVEDAFSTAGYRSLGQSDGRLPVYRIDRLEEENGRNRGGFSRTSAENGRNRGGFSRTSMERGRNMGEFSRTSAERGRNRGGFSRTSAERGRNRGEFSRSSVERGRNRGEFSRSSVERGRNRGKLCQSPVVIACAGKEVLEGKDYQVILNACMRGSAIEPPCPAIVTSP